MRKDPAYFFEVLICRDLMLLRMSSTVGADHDRPDHSPKLIELY